MCWLAPLSPVIITVQNGEVQSLSSKKTGQTFIRGQGDKLDKLYFDAAPTFPELFQQIQAALEKKAFLLSVIYEPMQGYPRQLNIDYDWLTIDDEIEYVISDFEKL